MNFLGLTKHQLFCGGTFSGNPLTMAGGIGMLEYLKENKETIYPYLHEQGDRMPLRSMNFVDLIIFHQMMNAGSMMHLIFGSETIESS